MTSKEQAEVLAFAHATQEQFRHLRDRFQTSFEPDRRAWDSILVERPIWREHARARARCSVVARSANDVG
jgi:hypothetical protein